MGQITDAGAEPCQCGDKLLVMLCCAGHKGEMKKKKKETRPTLGLCNQGGRSGNAHYDGALVARKDVYATVVRAAVSETSKLVFRVRPRRGMRM